VQCQKAELNAIHLPVLVSYVTNDGWHARSVGARPERGEWILTGAPRADCERIHFQGETSMSKLLRGLAAGYGAKRLGGGCFSTVLIFIVLWWLLGHFGIFR
jgi:hypothetical protein